MKTRDGKKIEFRLFCRFRRNTQKSNVKQFLEINVKCIMHIFVHTNSLSCRCCCRRHRRRCRCRILYITSKGYQSLNICNFLYISPQHTHPINH